MTLVFVSYARQDRDMALKLAERLRKAAPAGMEIAIDEAADGDLVNTASDTYRLPYVGRRLRNANAVVPVLTRSYAESDPCWLELSASLMMEKVVPISLDPGLSPAGISCSASGSPPNRRKFARWQDHSPRRFNHDCSARQVSSGRREASPRSRRTGSSRRSSR
jgi:hypothetical protein